MGKLSSIRTLFLLLSFICTVSCQRSLYDEDDESIAETNVPLKVSTRAGGDSQIDYPVYVYAFDPESGSCVASQQIEDDGESIELDLSPAKYTIVAIAGLGEEYTIPESPNIDEVITMLSNNRSSRPMMMGRATITAAKGQEAFTTVTLYYAVSMVSITLQDIPSTTESVSLCISPLYSALSLDGGYSGGGNDTEIACTLGSDGTWSCDPFYIFPGSSSQTVISITLKDEDETTTTYGYTYTKGGPEANVPFNINGSYTGKVTVSGDLITGDWEDPVDVTFDFGSQTVDESTDDETYSGGSLSAVPSVGSVLEEGIVAAIESEDSEGAYLMMMSLDEWTSLAEDAETTVAEAVAEGWSIPNYTEAHTLYDAFAGDNLDEVNGNIEEAGSDNPTISTTYRYLYNSSGIFYAFGFKSTSTFAVAGEKTKYKIRLVRRVYYTVN